MWFFALSPVTLDWLILLRNVAFAVLDCGVLLVLLTFSLKGSKSALFWLLEAALVSATLFAISLSHLKHQMLGGAPSPSSLAPAGDVLARTVQESGDAVMTACLILSGIFIVLEGLRLAVLFSRTRVPNGSATIVRFLFGALLCVGILGIGLSVRWAPVLARECSAEGTWTLKKSEAPVGPGAIER